MLTPADPADVAAALAFPLRYSGRKRAHNADEIMAGIVAKPLVEHLHRSGFVVDEASAGDRRGGAWGRGLRDDRAGGNWTKGPPDDA